MERTNEAIGTGADVVSTACPYCMIMLDDAVRANAKEDDVRVMDLSQLLEESMAEPVAVGAGAPAVAESAPAEEPTADE
jgi:Fe-S oxidoreductase